MDHGIESVRAMWVLDSRGTPTVKAQVTLASGVKGCACAPSGASTGAHEAWEKRDREGPFRGKGVQGAVAAVNGEIAKALAGMDVFDQKALDRRLRALDGTENLSRLGANAVLPVSMACARAGAEACRLPLYRYLGGVYANKLPMPMMNVLNGGAHAGNNLDIQEFMIRPVGAESLARAVEMGVEIYWALGDLLAQKGRGRGLGDEGGYAPNLEGDEAALALLVEAIKRAGYAPGQDVTLALDVAASGWADVDGYRLPKAGRRMTRDEMIQWYAHLVSAYPVDSIEDPLGEEDFEGFARLRQKLPGVQIVGDDLFVTNPARLERGIKAGSATAVLVKPNQIGTVTSALDCVRMAHGADMKTVISHRSGETGDSFIADLSVAVNAGQIKTGAPARGERTSKYNRLLEIEGELNQIQRG